MLRVDRDMSVPALHALCAETVYKPLRLRLVAVRSTALGDRIDPHASGVCPRDSSTVGPPM
jgi:hypothetical protein